MFVMTRDYGKKKSLISEINDFLFLTAAKITCDSNSKILKITLPDGLEFDVTVDRFLDIF